MNQTPSHLNHKILNSIHEKLHPKLSLLLGKVFLIHMLTAVITLSVCPQFGFKLFNFNINLMHSFMFFGLPICNLMCGLFFTATSGLAAAIILKRDEVRAIVYRKALIGSAVILSSIGFFAIMNPNIFLEFSFMWLIGAVAGIISTFEIGNRVLARF
ncbi:MAG: hypothetical protein HOP07_07175 [Bacteriovoracaceae bacterium]|nr:hypothetical protein [Bacteriovoracaceae bacterium]